MNFETLKHRWESNTISEQMLKVYVKKGIITPNQYEEITDKKYN